MSSLFCITLNSIASVELGKKLLSAKDFPAAQSEFQKAANDGDIKAQYLLGIGVLQGKYFPQDEGKGIQILRDASQRGSAEASYALFRYVVFKRLLPLSEAIQILELAEKQGSMQAKFALNNLRGNDYALTFVYADFEQFVPVEIPPLVKGDISAALKNGELVYQRVCVACHEIGIANAPKRNDTARWKDLRKKGFATLVENAAKGYKAHPARGGDYSLSGEEIRNAVLFMASPMH